LSIATSASEQERQRLAASFELTVAVAGSLVLYRLTGLI